MYTGLIFAAVVVAWAFYLVPLALKRYDEAMRARSIESFSQAMRVLGRRAPRVSGRTVLAPSRPLAEPRLLKPSRPEAEPVVAVAPPSRSAARLAARRRRRTLLSLLGAVAVVGAAAVVGVLPLWTPVIPVALVLAWLVACRLQVSRETDATWTRVVANAAAGDPDRDGQSHRAARVDSAYGTRPAPAGDEPDDEPTVVLEAALIEQTTTAVAVTTADGGSLWDPLPVTLPTYVGKPKATRTIRTVDLAAPGTWTSGHVEGEQTELPGAAIGSDAEHRPAVGD
ncbi:MAG: divisome protein SepX/GlpR [Nocardioidaceae bacterium]